MTVRTVGVEEELLLVDPETGILTGVAQRALRAHEQGGDDDEPHPEDAPVEAELFTQQIETQTPPCTKLDELEQELRRGRRSTCEAATAAGAAAVAIGTPVLVDRDVEITHQPRYQRIREEYGAIAHSALACAMHVHVEIDDLDQPDQRVRVLDGIAPWLPVLLALSANSPFAYGHDTGHASWRTQVWSRWPSHGTGQPFHDEETYETVARRITEWGAGLDDGMLYFNARLAREQPTVEIRVADVTTELDDAVMVAALSRALVDTCAAAEEPLTPWRSDLLRAATWRASRYGVSERLVEPLSLELAPARDAVASLVDLVRPSLEEAGDTELVEQAVERVFARGNGAVQQRRRHESGAGLSAVVEDCVRRTEASWREA